MNPLSRLLRLVTLACGLASCAADEAPLQPAAGGGAGTQAGSGSGGGAGKQAGSGGNAGAISTGGPSGAGSVASGSGGSGASGSGAAQPCTSCGACAEEKPVLSANHVVGPIEYLDPPPVGGEHDACWAAWGVHSEAVPARNWVHNLEHGGVVFLHNCPDGCASDLAAFSELASANQRTLLTPYPELRTRFALVAWGHRILSDCVDAEAFQAFYDGHFDQGRESVASDPPADCN